MLKNLINSKILRFSFLAAVFINSILIAGCKNFLSGEDLLTELEKQINYAYLPYANITISAPSDYTKEITPFAGLYDEKYKNNDKIDLSFLPKDDYQFISWSVEPENAVSFEDKYSPETIATIENTNDLITIKPICVIRPTVSFEPEMRSDGVAKNTSIVITFSQPMDISQEDLQKISISSGFENLTYNFQTPILSENKQKITFLADRKNLIGLTSGTKLVTITIPQDFHYIYENTNVELKEITAYSYRINPETSDKAIINIKASEKEGQISYSGSKTFYLDDEMKIKFTPDSSYVIQGWKIVNTDGEEINESILQTEVSEDLQTLSLKILTGYEKEIQIQPICTAKGKLTINFTKSENFGEITPTETKEYCQQDEFNISYTEGTSGYSFLYWSVYDSLTLKPTDAVSFENTKASTTKVTILKDTQNITIKPICAIRPTISIEPEMRSDGVAKNTPIVITFSQPMEITQEDLTKIVITNGLEDISGKFLYPPKLEQIDGKTVITFLPDRNNLVQLTSGTKIVTVTIPQSFYYINDNNQVTLKDNFTHSYRVNTQTLDKATINVSTVLGGEINYTGSATYNLDEELTITYTPLSTYEFEGWSIKNKDGSELGNGILEKSETEKDGTYKLNIKILTGHEQEIQIKPICTEKPKITVHFSAPEHGSLSPSGQKDYSLDETFELTYTEGTSGYAFTGWTVLDSNKKPITDVVNLSSNSKCTATFNKNLQNNREIYIEPIIKERPTVKFITPSNGDKEIIRDTSIRIQFSQTINPISINTNITVKQGSLSISSENFSYSSTDVSNKLSYEFNSSGDFLTISPSKNFNFDANAFISIFISKDLKNIEGIPFGTDYEIQFQTSNLYESLAPKITIEAAKLNGTEITKFDYHDITKANQARNLPQKLNELLEVDTNLTTNMVTNDNHTIELQNVTAVDLFGSGIGTTFEQSDNVKSIGYNITKVYPPQTTTKPDYSGSIPYTGNDKDGMNFSIDLKNLDGKGTEAPEGILRIDVYAIDKNGNDGFIEPNFYKFQNGYNSFYVIKETKAPQIKNASWNYNDIQIDFNQEPNASTFVNRKYYLKVNIEEDCTGLSQLAFKSHHITNYSSHKIYYSEKDDFEHKTDITDTVDIKYYSNYDSIPIFSINFNKNESGIFTENKSGFYYITNILENAVARTENLEISMTDASGLSTQYNYKIEVDDISPILMGLYIYDNKNNWIYDWSSDVKQNYSLVVWCQKINTEINSIYLKFNTKIPPLGNIKVYYSNGYPSSDGFNNELSNIQINKEDDTTLKIKLNSKNLLSDSSDISIYIKGIFDGYETSSTDKITITTEDVCSNISDPLSIDFTVIE